MYFDRPTAQQQRSKLGLGVIEEEFAIYVRDFAMVSANTDVSDLDVAVLPPSNAKVLHIQQPMVILLLWM